MTRDEAFRETRRLIAAGERLQGSPSLGGLRLWLQLSDDLLSAVWGSMDRYHLAWLMVGKSRSVVRGRRLEPEEEAAEVREVVAQKTAALRMSLQALEEQQMPFVGDTAGRAPSRGASPPERSTGSESGPLGESR